MLEETKLFLKNQYNLNSKLLEISEIIENSLSERYKKIEEVVQHNQFKVLNAMQKNRLSDSHFAGTSGYGYGDAGRDIIDKIYAEVFEAEDALVRHSFISGTHAITTALFGILRPGDTLLYATGRPYDTLEEVIGIRGEGKGSLKDFGVNYKQSDLLDNGDINYPLLEKLLTDDVKVVAIQRSRGYAWRNSFNTEKLKELITFIKSKNSDIICFVDNCYCEFVETKEPTSIGADLCAGSLIKNPGAGLAPTGGYVVGKKELIEKVAYRLTTPGTGKEVGSTLGFNKSIAQGLFLAPHVVGESLKGAIFAASIFEKFGFDVSPKFNTPRTDIVQAIKFGESEKLISFCQSIQKASPVDSFAIPQPWDMPGYEDKVIMAAGTFVQGASIELSADAPIRAPYIAYMQGGLTSSHVKYAVIYAINEMIEKGLLSFNG